MNDRRTGASFAPASLALVVSAGLLASACIDEQPGIMPNDTAGAASGGNGASLSGSSAAAGASSEPLGGEHSAAAGAAATPQGGTTSGGSPSGGTNAVAEGGGAGEPGVVGEGGETAQPQACVFHTDAVGSGEAGEGGAAAMPTITMQTSPFVGTYLADGAGRTLFTYGNDLPGDCQPDNSPRSRCEADCLVSWPVFDAGARVLGPGLSDAGFGSIQRGDGTWQTTYFGWPLYYYKTDLTLGQMAGQGKGKTWHVAETTPASIVIMKEGAIKYLADGAGYTLYVSAADSVGSGNTDPVSSCSGDCLQTFQRFHQKSPSIVPSLEQADFSVFVSGAAELQLAFKGRPLYRARSDGRAGDTTGTATAGFTVAMP
jgi:predicted lipoprotein with Yx(FWY)xxD motif